MHRSAANSILLAKYVSRKCAKLSSYLCTDKQINIRYITNGLEHNCVQNSNHIFAVHFRCIHYDNIEDFFSQQRKGSPFRQNPIVVKWSTISFISFLSFPLIFDPAYECKCMSSSTLLNILYYKVTLLEKHNLTFPIGNSRVPYILESHDEKLEVLYEKDDFDRISIHTT